MLLTFGRSAFAMPPVSGVVLAAGSVVASAGVTGTGRAAKNGLGAAAAVASPVGNPTRHKFAAGQAVAPATLSGAGRLLASVLAAAVARAVNTGAARCDAKGAGAVVAAPQPTATASRVARMVVGGRVTATAVVEGEGQNRVRVVPLAVIARASVWGTTHHVGQGAVVCGSGATGQAVRTLNPVAEVAAKATASNVVAIRRAVCAGDVAARAIGVAGVRRKVSGVGYQDGFGDAIGGAVVASGVVNVTPVLLIIARAVLSGRAEVAYSVRGDAVASAQVEAGVANLVPTTQLGGAVVSSAATGTAMVTCYISSAVGVCSVRAHPAAAVLRATAAGGLALSISVDAAQAEVIKIAAGDCTAGAETAADGVRIALAQGRLVIGAALTDADVQLNPLAPATYVIEVEVPDNLIEADVPENLVMVDAFDTLVEAA